MTEGILFLVRHLLLTLSRNRPRCVCVLHLILQSSSQENRVVQAGGLNGLMQQPHCIWRWHVCCRWRMALLSQKHVVHTLDCSDHTSDFILSPSYMALQLICFFLNDHQSFYFFFMYLSISPFVPLFSVFSHSVCRRARRSNHVSSLPPGSPHDSQGAQLLERCCRHGLLYLWLFSGRPAARSV